MKNILSIEMKKVYLKEYFEINSTIQDDKINFKLSNLFDINAVPFVGRASINNGITDYVLFQKNKINEGGIITIALDGSTGSTFYQHHNFCSGQNIWQLIPKKEKFDKFNIKIALFLITTIRKAVQNYSYNLSLTKTRLLKIKILLPVLENNKVNTKIIEEQIDNLRNIKEIENISEIRVL